MTEVMIYEKPRSLAERIVSGSITLGLVAMGIWFSAEQGGAWALITALALLAFLVAKTQCGARPRLLMVSSKQQAIQWAESLPDDKAAKDIYDAV